AALLYRMTATVKDKLAQCAVDITGGFTPFDEFHEFANQRQHAILAVLRDTARNVQDVPVQHSPRKRTGFAFALAGRVEPGANVFQVVRQSREYSGEVRRVHETLASVARLGQAANVRCSR